MRNLFTLAALVAVILLSSPVFAQVTHLCDHHHYMEEALEEDPGYAQRLQELEEFTQAFVQRKESEAALYVVPVVVHIMHTFGAENISREQVLSAIQQLNLDYTKTNPDTSLIINEFKAIAGNAGIRFRLAQKDPQGNCTDGIVRVYTPLTHAANDDVKDVSRWPRDSYLNIWVVGTIASGAAGYSYYPGVNSSRDGVVLRSDYMGSIGTSSPTRARTLTHEVGHWLNLAHPWGNSNDPGLPENCNTDDSVEDTPNTIGHTSCNLSAVSCGSLDNVQNFMEYSYCTRMFTIGQGQRMLAALNSGASDRNELWQENNLWQTGTHNFYQALDCAPIAEFSTSQTFTCENAQIHFKDQSYNAEVGHWIWSFPGGIPDSSTERNPVVTYSTAGLYSVSLISFSQTGSDTIFKENYINIQTNDSNMILPFSEGFETTSFPEVTNFPFSQWHLESDVEESWVYSDFASASGNGSIFVNNRMTDYGSVHTLTSPIINIPDQAYSIKMNFKFAYSQQDSDSDDEFKVQISKDCGETWMLRFISDGYFLSSTGTPTEDIFIPTASQWRLVDRDLDALLAGASSFHIRFQLTNGGGNNFYLDDLNITTLIGTPEFAQAPSIQVFPNPASKGSTIHLNSSMLTKARVELLSMQGHLLISKETELKTGENTLFNGESLSLSSGIYLVRVITPKGTSTSKLVIR
jgi:PKD repeat protein